MDRLLILLLFIAAFTTNAQEKHQTIWGTITDGTVPISGVNVTLSGSDEGTSTDANGKYEIQAIAGDLIEFSYVGMKTVHIRVEDVTRILNVVLWPKIEKLDEVVVTRSKRKTQRDLEIDYAIDKNIINTSFGYLSASTAAYRLQVIDGSELNNAAVDILSAIQNQLPGMSLNIFTDPETGISRRGLSKSAGRGRSAMFEVDGMVFTDAPTWIDINNVERIGFLSGLQAAWRYGSMAVGGVIFINTKSGRHGAREEGSDRPYDRAKLRHNIFKDDALGVSSLEQASPIYLRELFKCKTIETAERVFERYAESYRNSPYYFIDSYNFFMEKGHRKYAKRIADEALKKVQNNAMFLKSWAYYFEGHDDLKTANDIYEQVFILRPNYAQSYRDLANSYRSVGDFNKAARIYARYQYLRDEELLNISDSTAINTIIERESDNLMVLETDHMMAKRLLTEREERFSEFDGTRMIFEWNDSEAEFDLQFVNPQKHFHNWEHTTLADFERIDEEKLTGYSCEEFLMDGSLPGKWQVNVIYKGNKRLEPVYLKTTIYYNYGTISQRKEVQVYRLGLKNVNQKLFEVFNSGGITTN